MSTAPTLLRFKAGRAVLIDLPHDLVTDAQLAALAIEHGVPVVSVDSDFARFGEINWINPLAR